MSEPASEAAGSSMRTAYLAIKSQQTRIAELERALGSSREPVAIVGIGCRFPGGARGPAAFWERLRAGFDAVREVPAERWDAGAYFDADPEAPGRICTRNGAFLDDVDRFDARFFGITPREAASMDPQQRLLLETSWEAFEDAGIAPPSLAGSASGVFVGLTVIDYQNIAHGGDPRRLDPYFATGNVANIAAGRLSYVYGLRGPSVALDTACSSSLVAVHLAVQSLRLGESTLALAAGVNLILAPDSSVAVSRARMLSPSGRCRSFDAAADGYVRGEGCGVVVMKLLSRAVAEGDRIHAVIRGSAVAQDGARSGLTVPNGPAQASVIRAALSGAGVAPVDVSYLEAHGTGTSLGDPIEAGALAAVFAREGARRAPLLLGSLKTNVGHMESAAGIGGLIKAALAVRHGEIPPHLHFRRENPELHLSEIPARVPVRLEPWPEAAGPRVAGVSSFGSSGTIAHVVLAEPPAPAERGVGVPMPAWLLLSAKSPGALERLRVRMAEWLSGGADGHPPGDICWTAAAGRAHFEHRLAVVGEGAEGLAAALSGISEAPKPGSAAARYLEGGAPDLGALFGGARGRVISLPTYPFSNDRHWVEPARTPLPRTPAARPVQRSTAPEFGIMFFNGAEGRGSNKYRLVFEAARFADANGFSSVWMPERHFTGFGALYPSPQVVHAALSRETRNVRLMSGSTVLPLHDVLRMVEEWSVVDNLSGGRVGISFASGWNPADFALAAGNYEDRHDLLFKGIEEARRLWRGNTVTRRAGGGAEVSVRIYPTPVQPELPLWVTAAGNPRTFERAGEAGANLLTHLLDHDVAGLAKKLERYRAGLVRSGRAADSGRVTVMLHTFLGPDQASVDATVKGPYCRYLGENLHLFSGLAASRGRQADLGALPVAEREGFIEFLYDRFASKRALLGTPEACRPLVSQLAEAGVDEIACLLDFGPGDEDILAMLPRLSEFKDAMRRACATRKASAASPAPAPNHVDLPDCILEVAWRPVSLVPNPPAASRPEAWAIVGAGAVGEALARRLREHGQDVDLLGGPGGLGRRYARVVNLLPLTEAEPVASALALVQQGSGRLWTVTRGAQAVGGEAPDPAGAAVWGLLRALPVEQPVRWGGLVDLDPGRGAEEQGVALWSALTTGSREDQLALREQVWHAARLAPTAAAALQSPPFDPVAAGAWIVTGGLGGIGWAFAERLVARGAREILLVGRRAADPSRLETIGAWRRSGVRVESAAADCGQEEQLVRALAAWRSAGGSPFGGVLHAAGSWSDSPLMELSAGALEAVWHPKVRGAEALARVLRSDPVSIWIYCSAFSAVLPAHGQGNYAAANAWLDAFARGQAATGVRSVSINWGPWSDVGFASTDYGMRAHARLESLGVGRLRPSQAFALLERLAGSGLVQAGAMPVDWERFFAADPQARYSPLLAELSEVHAGQPLPEAGGDRISRALAALPPEGQQACLVEELRRLVGAVLRLAPGDIPTGVPFTELGVDSLMAVELKNRLRREAGVDVPLTDLLRGPTAEGLAAAVLPRAKASALAFSAAAAGPVEEIEL